MLGSFYGGSEAWLHMQLHFTAATKLITSKNVQKPKNEEMEEWENGQEECKVKRWDELQGRHSTNFEHQVSLWFFSFCLFLCFSVFAVCFLSLHNKSLRKAFQFKWMKKKANVLCMQQKAEEWTRGRRREDGKVAEQTKCEWCAWIKSKTLSGTRFAHDFHDFHSNMSESLENLSKHINIIVRAGNEEGVVSWRRHLAKHFEARHA